MKIKFCFLTKLSLKKKIGTKWFFAAQAVMMLVIIALFNINSIIAFFGGDFSDDVNIYIVDNTNDTYTLFETNFNSIYNNLDILNKYILINSDSLKNAKKEVEENSGIILEINTDETNFISANIFTDETLDDSFTQIIQGALNNTKSQIALNHLNISSNDLAQIYNHIELTYSSLTDEINEEEQASNETILSIISFAIGIPIFMISIYLISMIGAEINEEKSTRSMEIIVSNVSPLTHFFSKILSVNIFALLQSFLLVIYGLLGLLASDLINKSGFLGGLGEGASSLWANLVEIGLVDKLWYLVPLILLMLILTFIGYSLLAGILASMTTNMEDFQQLQTPVIMISLIGYYIALASTSFDGSVFIKIASYIPFISAIVAPGLFAGGYTTIIDYSISISLLIIFCFLLLKYGLRIYKVGILNYSSEKLWSKIFKATKNNG